MAVAIPSSATLDASARFEAELWESHVADLRQQLRGAGLSTAGRKAQLVERILYATDWAEHDMGDASAAESEPEPEPEAVGRGSRASDDNINREWCLDGGQQVGSGVGTIVAALSAWLIVATAFYTEYYGWTVAESFYYAVDSGLSIGTGVDGLEDTTDGGRWFTIVNVLVGSFATASALAIIAEYSVDQAWATRQSRMDSVIDDDESILRGTLTYRIGRELTTPVAYFLYAWLMVGTVFGMVVEEWTCTRAFYFALTQLASGGLQAPSRTDVSLVFTAGFALIGHPLFALLASGVAAIIYDDHTRQRSQATRTQSCVVAADIASHEGRLDWGKYLALRLTQRGLVDKEMLQQIEHSFRQLDAAGRVT